VLRLQIFYASGLAQRQDASAKYRFAKYLTIRSSILVAGPCCHGLAEIPGTPLERLVGAQ
jgi:hypothetical protein